MTGLTALLAAFSLLSGCGGNGVEEKLGAAYQQLDGPNPNYVEIAGAADAYLKENPTGPAAADALYLHGRALEAKSQRDPASPQRDWADAYNYYTQALAQKPRPALEGLIHVGMGNILYFQDRYGAASTELSAGYDKLDRDTGQGAGRFIGSGCVSSGLGKWPDADRNFCTGCSSSFQIANRRCDRAIIRGTMRSGCRWPHSPIRKWHRRPWRS